MNKHLMVGLIASLGLVACGGGSSGDATAGKSLFEQPVLGTGSNRGAGCVTCHAVTAGAAAMSGPNLAGYGTLAGTKFSAAGKASAHEYAVDAIIAPDEEITDGFQKGVMATNYGTVLTVEQQNNIAAYLLTLK